MAPDEKNKHHFASWLVKPARATRILGAMALVLNGEKSDSLQSHKEALRSIPGVDSLKILVAEDNPTNQKMLSLMDSKLLKP